MKHLLTTAQSLRFTKGPRRISSAGVSAALSILAAAGCSGGGGSDFNGLGVVNQSPSSCAITTTSPSSDDLLRVSGLAGALTPISVGLSKATCDVTFTLNGSSITSTGSSLNLPSDSLHAGTNTLVAHSGDSEKTWTIKKNTPPACGPQSPAATGSNLGVGGTITLSGAATDADADPLTFAWQINGTPNISSSILNVISGATASQAIFNPSALYLGSDTVRMVVSDGIDSTNCDWNVAVNGSCFISSTTPSTSSNVRIAQNASSTSLFQASATTGCLFTWKLNGGIISGQTAANFALDPALLTAGSNTLEVSVGNGSTTDSKTWTVTRNIPPICATQNPGATGNNVGVGGHITLSATAADPNNDPLTFTWQVNGSPTGTQFAITSTGNSTQAIFTPDSSSSGTNNVKAVISDGLDATSCNWAVQTVPVCGVASASPGTSSFRMPASSSASQNFVVTPNDPSCSVTWQLNGSSITGNQILALASSQLQAGPATNTLVATVANGTSSVTKTWTISKNQPPTCASQTPGISGNNVGVGGNITFQATAGNADSDALIYSWSYNGSPASPAYFTSTSSGNAAQTTFVPTASQLGNNQAVALSIDDGYDATTCNWNVNVLNSCVIASTTPTNPGPVKVPNLSTATTPFVASANAGCTYSWSVNGTPVSGATSNGYYLPSSSLNTGNNTLQVSVTNGVSTDTKAWTVVKNTPPTCGSQNPTVLGNSVGVGGNITFQITPGNTDNDTLNYAWSYNGATVTSAPFTPSAFGSSAQIVFAPTSAYVGTNQNVGVVVNDGYDSQTCNWAVDVANSCTISATSPSVTAGAVRVPSLASATKAFQASANAGCNYTWSLNGSPISGATAATYSAASGDLTPGNNTLTVSVTNGTSSDSKSWTVVKNTPPVCSSQSPGATGNNIAVGGNLTLVANATDANNDALTFAWKDNGTSAGSQFAITGATGTSQAVFSPDATNVGANAVQAVISDGYDSVNCAWNVQVAPSCQISSASPAGTSTKVSFASATSTSFVATPSDASCNMSWTLNGSTIGGATGPTVNVLSSSLTAAPGTNTLVATATNGYSTATRTWTIGKNQPPICSTQSPSSAGNAVAAGATLTFQAGAGNPDSDILSYAWSYNGTPVNASLFATSASGNNAQAIFSPTTATVGNNQTVAVTIDDSYDTAQCAWNVNVLNACSLSSLSPAGNALKVAALGSTQTAFSANATTGCNYTWSLNGTAIPGATSGSYSVPSSSLSTGSNTLSVAISNGVSNDSKSWTVTKNAPPTCSSQSPASTGGSVGVGGSVTFQANAGNTDGDTLAYSWLYNGAAANPANFAISSFGNSAQAIFSPTSAYIGSSQAVAVAINDGYDTAQCSWNVAVQNSCTISTMTPSNASSNRVAYAAGTTNLFQALANSGCNYTWSLNGSPLSGVTAASYALSSGDLSPGNNTLTVSVTNGTTTDTKSWTVVRNTPPVCSSQTPNATGNTTAVGNSSSFVANATDANSDVLTFAWKLNGNTAASQLAVTNGTGTSTAAFTPDSTSIGNDTLTATISDGYDATTCSWTAQVLPACVISTATPSTASPKIPFLASTDNSFVATTNDNSCALSWSLNGYSLGITAPNAHVASSQFNASPGTNTLVATATNGYTTATRTWTVTKNVVPTCASQSPASTGGTVGVGGNLTFAATAGNTDGDTLAYNWTYNGAAASSSAFATSFSGNNAQAVFTPTSSYVGSSQSVGLTINDGYDSAQCSWNVAVANACIISSTSPVTTGTVRMANGSSSNSSFTAFANAGCNYSWTLNGSPISGQTAATLALSSSLLNGGTNMLAVTASNGTSSDSKSWTILKNSPPVCASQSPAASGSVIPVGASQSFVANATDANSDNLTYTWFDNGAAAGSQFAITSGVGTSTAVLTPNSALVGANTIRADISDGYDTTSCSWTATVKSPCAIASSTPSASTTKMGANGSYAQDYVATANDSSCALSWKLNGTALTSTTSVQTVTSSQLSAAPATNTLVATATDGYTSATHSWTINKNQPATCGTQTPSSTGNSVGVGGNITFQLAAGNPDSDTLSYSWNYNGSTVSSAPFTPSSFGNSAQIVFAPTSAYVGTNQNIGVVVNDGYDSQTCSWNVDVLNTCTISTTLPAVSGGPVRVPALSSATKLFQASANAGCNYTWSLNGSPISGATSGSYTAASSDLTPGNNTLTVSVTNGTSTDTKSWTVVKNTPPVCASQTPSATGNNIAVGGNLTLVANATDANSDALTFAWKNNGSNVGSQFAVTSTASAGQAVFSPDATNVGTNSVQAVISDGYDSVNCAWNVQVAPSCQISSATPSASSTKVAAAGSTSSTFVASPSDASCALSWSLNGTTISGATSASVSVLSSSLNATNTLTATATNGYSTATRSWTVTKNQPPTCSTQSPNATGNNVASGGSLTFQATAGNADSDPLTYAWLYNGATANPSSFATSSTGNTAQAVFSPTNAAIGNNQAVAVNINDGYDTAQCAWNVNVLNACSLSSIAPAASSLKVAALGTTQTAFSANATTGCNFTWSLNGTAIVGATSGAYSVPSSSLATGSNTLTVAISNGYSSDTRSWTVTKNAPPTCASQTPAATGGNVGVGGSITFQANAGNTDGDTLNYNWTYNGAATSAAFTNSAFGNQAQSVFTPTSAYIGSGQTVAVAINDGYDTAQCSWNFAVQNSCTISTTTPSAASPYRVAAAAGTSTSFQASANAGCNYSWSLNGTPISGVTASSYAVASSDLSPGNNNLVVTVTNGTTSDSKTWTVVKNTPPACSSQTPSTSGNTTAVGNTTNFVANGTDANSDALTFAWKLNGAASASQLAISTGTGTSTAAFTPDTSSVGNNTLTAAISDGYDTTNCAWTTQVLPACVISSSTPATSTAKIPFAAATDNLFFASTNDSSCNLSWSLNGSSLGLTSPNAHIASSQFSASPATNTLVATSTNGYTTATRTWTVTKNVVPSCASQTPAATGGTVGVGGSLNFSATAGNTDGDTLAYNWTYNGSAVSGPVFTTSSSGNTAQATFTPSSAYVGSGQTIALAINDGYDGAQCSWNVAVANACVISSASPSTGSTVRMANSSSYNSTFSASANAGCNFAWSLNGTTISGQTAATLNLGSGLLSSGNNTLVLTASNGTSTDSKTWNILKNSPPICSSQSPSSSGTVVAVGATQNFVANAADANGDPLTYSWTDNGTATGAQFAITSSGGTSTAVMTANSVMVGSNAIQAIISDGYDTTTCSWSTTVKPPCAISSSSPSAATVKMAANGTSSQDYVASVSDSSCAITWKLNGSALSSTSSVQTVTSSQLSGAPATNTLVATATDGFTTATRSWTLTKNQAPTCASQTPIATGNSVSVGGNMTFASTAGNPDSDTLTYSWLYNGAPVGASFTVSSSGNNSQAIFNPPASYVGNNQSVGVTISDGYDNASCSWTVSVVNSCSIGSPFPATSTVKLANLASAQTSFGGIPSDNSCAPSWTLNGTAISTSAIVTLNSSTFLDGPATNSLVLTLNNGVSTPTTRTWTVTKNRVPSCASQTPSASPGAMTYSATRNFSATGSDPDGDTLSGFTWLYNGAASNSLFTSVASSPPSGSATFVPTFSQVGSGQTVSLQFTDGYDTNKCNWSFDITNPNTVSITSCTPTGNPIVVYSTGGNATQTLQVNAANATANGYVWYKNGSAVSGATSSTYSISSTGYSAGNYAIRGVASDAQGNTAYCDYTVKVNAAPTISANSPATSQTWRLNYGTTMNFSVTAADANNDALTYTWTLDGAANAALGSGTAATILNPNNNSALLGAHTVAVSVSDGYESVSLSWPVEINYFTPACNALYNSGSSGGQICTLVGVPGIGNGNVPSADQTLIRTNPAYVIDDGGGNWIFTDQLSHTVNFYNRSGAAITRWGLTYQPGTMNVILGNGASGITIDGLYNRQFKLDTPMGLAFDSATNNLFVADYNNNRVAMMDNTGLVSTVLGAASGAYQGNNATYNTDGTNGSATGCANPADVHIINYSGTRYLYTSCAGMNAIKRLDVLPSSGNYLKASMVIGRLNGSSATFAGTADGTWGTAGLALTNQPWALADDGAGNLYWSESNGYRVRGVMLSGNAPTFFGGGLSQGINMSAVATDTGFNLSAGSVNIQPTVASGTPTKLGIVGPNSLVVTTGCGFYRVQSLNSSSNIAAVTSATSVALTGAGTGGGFYSDAACGTSISSVTIASGAVDATFYYRATTAATNTLTATATGLTNSLFPVNVAATSTATKIVGVAPSSYIYNTCLPVLFQLQNASNVVSTYTSARTLSVATNSFGTFYSNNTCTTQTTTVTIAAGATDATVYFAPLVKTTANQTVSLFGGGASNSSNAATTPQSFGLLNTRYPRGLAVAASGGNVSGFFVTNWDYHRISFVNNTAGTIQLGGVSVTSYNAAMVAGTGTAGFNSDGLGSTSRLNQTYGISFSADSNKLLMADATNYRVRSFDVSTGNGNLVTELGAGRVRAGNLGDATTPASLMYTNGPTGMVMDTANRKLYFSDSLNSRIRVVDMLTGAVNTMIGKGSGAATVENEDPTNAYLGNPRGLALMSASGTNFLLYGDQVAGSSTNQDCQVRAMNLTPNIGSPSAATLLGVSINPYKVATLAGDYALGCGTAGAYSPSSNVAANTSATTLRMNNTEGIASDGTNLYVSNYSDHCIVKVNASGAASVVVGTCGTAGTTDGSASSALIRFPTAIVMDPQFAADGNFFFADAPDVNPTRIRYVNFRTSSVSVAGYTVPAASGGYPQVLTLFTVALSGGARVYGLAANGSQICWAGGYPTSGSIGTHNVSCYDRSNSPYPITLRVGANESSTPAYRAGAPLSNTEQEGVLSSNSFLGAPYGLTFDAAGNLYIAERNNHMIRMVRRWY